MTTRYRRSKYIRGRNGLLTLYGLWVLILGLFIVGAHFVFQSNRYTSASTMVCSVLIASLPLLFLTYEFELDTDRGLLIEHSLLPGPWRRRIPLEHILGVQVIQGDLRLETVHGVSYINNLHDALRLRDDLENYLKAHQRGLSEPHEAPGEA